MPRRIAVGPILAVALIGALALYVGAFFWFTEYVRDPSHWADHHRRMFPSEFSIRMWRPMRIYDRLANPATHWESR